MFSAWFSYALTIAFQLIFHVTPGNVDPKRFLREKAIVEVADTLKQNGRTIGESNQCILAAIDLLGADRVLRCVGRKVHVIGAFGETHYGIVISLCRVDYRGSAAKQLDQVMTAGMNDITITINIDCIVAAAA